MLSPTVLERYLQILLLTWLAQAPFAHAAFIGLRPDPILAATGDSVSLDLVISELGNFGPESLGAFDISVGFDPAVLSFTSYLLGSFLGDIGLGEAIDAGVGAAVGSVNVAEVSLLSTISLDALQPDAFTLATLNFSVIDLAAGAVTQFSVLSDPVLAKASGANLPATVSGPASVEGIDPTVPLPGTLYLLIVSLFAWLALKWRLSFASGALS